MGTRIKLKRGTGAPTTSDLENNEIAMDMAAGKLYVNNAGSIVVLAEKNASADDTYTDAEAIAAVEGEATLDLTGDVSIANDKSILINNSAANRHTKLFQSNTGQGFLTQETLNATSGGGRFTAYQLAGNDGVNTVYLGGINARYNATEGNRTVALQSYDANATQSGTHNFLQYTRSDQLDIRSDLQQYSKKDGTRILKVADSSDVGSAEIQATGTFKVNPEPGSAETDLTVMQIKPDYGSNSVPDGADVKLTFGVRGDDGSTNETLGKFSAVYDTTAADRKFRMESPTGVNAMEFFDAKTRLTKTTEIDTGDADKIRSISGDLTLVNTSNGDDILLKVDDAGSTTHTGMSIKTDDYVSNDTIGSGGTDTTAYKSYIHQTGAGIKIGSESQQFSSTGNTPDNDEGDYEQNGIFIEPTGNSWPTLTLQSYGNGTGKNPVRDRFGDSAFGGAFVEYPNANVNLMGANGTVASPSAITSGKRLGQVAFTAYDGSQFGGSNSAASAAITVTMAEDAATNNDRAAKMEFEFTPAGGDGSVTGGGRTEVVTMQEDRVIFAPEGNEALRVDTEVKLGAPLNIDANAIEDAGNLVLEVDSGALKLYHNDDLRITTRQYDTYFENDVFSTSVFTLDATYPSRLVTSHSGVANNSPSLEVGQEGTSVEDAIIDFSLFDGGNYGSDRTQRIARLNAYSAGVSDNRLYTMLDDDGTLNIASQIKNDAGDITHFVNGILKVQHEHNGDDMLVIEQNEPMKVFSGSSAYATAQFKHTLDTADDNHTMAKFDCDFGSQTPYDVKFGFTAEVSGDNITGDDEGFCGRLDFEWKDSGNHEISFRADNYQNDVYHDRRSINATTSVTEINTMLKLNPIEMDTTTNRPAGSAGDMFFNTTTKNLQLYTNAWQDISNQRGMMFCNDSGVFYGYDGTNWKPFTMGTAL